MHWQKSPKEKPCYTLPTVKKLLEQKRKRETSSTATTSTGVSTATVLSQQVSTPEKSTSTSVASSYSDMAVGYERWGPMNEHQPLSAIQEGPFSPMGNNYFSSPSSSMDYSHTPAYSPQMASSYNTQQIQDYPDTRMPQHYTECPVTEAVSSLVPSGPLQTAIFSWSSGALGPTEPVQQVFSGQMDVSKLEEARMFLRGMDYSRTTWQDDDGDTILHIYTAKGLREYAFAAAERLAELGRLDSKEHKGKTALLVAVTANHPEIVQDLLSLGADINACDVKGQTALHLAATYGFPRVMQVILSIGPGVNLEARNFEGLTPLHCAAISHSGTLKTLSSLSSTGLGDASLHALAEEKLSWLQMLLNTGASLTSQEIKSNKTVLHLAVKEGNIQLVRHLLKTPLDNMRDFVNMKAHGHTALHMAAGLHGNPHQEEMLRLLLSRGADPSIRNLENDQPAHLLQSGPHGEQLKLILKKRSASSRRRVMSLQDQE
ncbi:NF-kappa-B inhibitor delta [Salmo salar]|uniref:NF-kappa-B inhibitor delta n=1 Tax=Salmo salar TaxID=8030 RepID=A0A1S3NAH0_SALSA|nr:NF-kappa-B inhibitor delta [Salmo salar]|eukprot:XP_014012444.1 PREDICTED: NF-kappa-B inhibitor delta-like isoform X1 [Salmo salar]